MGREAVEFGLWRCMSIQKGHVAARRGRDQE